MPQRKCASKRLRVDKTRSLANAEKRSQIKKEIKNFRSLVTQGKIDEAKAQLKAVFAKLDRAVSKGILHKNTASRRKSYLSRVLNKKA
ncbi:30S ribosomal protein S20 [Candidatus Velamenicoccus archaeovorus]|uniref:Small ribosomal subunit protein bS20 n=1 Tax=Velamenicoccus archaeovorus TaxID=1930593 RepID=A0A410P5N7_VELA1|nr:30S ribosomal protein S20 [Candidatus Velamenicoccus archaeovorus]QAT17506.1 30S ribosomal protein S20 [Candidatus Velamenicoccus archaeovorus]